MAANQYTHALSVDGRAYCGVGVGPGIPVNYVARRFFLESDIPHCPKCADIMVSIHIHGPAMNSLCGKVMNGDSYVRMNLMTWGNEPEICDLCLKRYEEQHDFTYQEDEGDDEEIFRDEEELE